MMLLEESTEMYNMIIHLKYSSLHSDWRLVAFSGTLGSFVLHAFLPLCLCGTFLWRLCLRKEKSVQKKLLLPVFARAATLTFLQKFRCVGVTLALLFQDTKWLPRYPV